MDEAFKKFFFRLRVNLLSVCLLYYNVYYIYIYIVHFFNDIKSPRLDTRNNTRIFDFPSIGIPNIIYKLFVAS